MNYKVIIPKSVRKMMDGLPANIVARIINHLETLESNPRPDGVKKLKGKDGWRIRVGGYRVVYKIIDDDRVVLLTKVGHRKDVYQ